VPQSNYLARQLAVIAVALLLMLATGSVASPRAHAGFTTCRSDPVVVLSNTATVDLQAAISDSTSDVRHVTYTLHVPAGLRVLAIVNTDGLIGLVETVNVYADDSRNTYDASTIVTTGQSAVPVTASAAVVSVLGVTLGAKSASGKSGQSLLIHFTSLL
jgi:hypothetical protein